MTMQRVDNHRMPSWPDGAVPKQNHRELAVDDLDEPEAAALAIGALKADRQPSPETWRVLIDPADHPFCVTSLIPDPCAGRLLAARSNGRPCRTSAGSPLGRDRS
jgi:hypothetical protein